MKKYHNQQQAFSIVELLTVVFIIGVLSSLTFANYRGNQRQNDLLTETKQLTSVIRRAQNMALTGYKTDAGSLTNYGYGIYIPSNNSTTYKLFIDQEKAGATDYTWDASSQDESLENYTLAPNLIIENAGCNNLTFARPHGQVYCNGVIVGTNENKIFSIKESGSGAYLYLRINSQGRVDMISSL